MTAANLRDEGDDKFVEAAVHVGAVVVTYNKRDYVGGDMGQFGWSVMEPREFIAIYL